MWLEYRPGSLTQTSQANGSHVAVFSYATKHHHSLIFVSTYEDCLPYKPHHVPLFPKSLLLLLCSISSLILASLSTNYLPILYSHLHFGLPFFIHLIDLISSRDSSVGIVTRLRAGRSGVRIPEDTRGYVLSETSRPALVPAQPPIRWPLMLKRTVRDAEVENECNHSSTPHTFLHGMNRDTFTFI